MRLPVYLLVIGVVMLVGFVLSHFQGRENTIASTFYTYSESPERFKVLAAQFARKTLAGPIARWEVYGGQGDIVVTEGFDRAGQEIIKCAFEKSTGRPLTILRFEGEVNDTPRESSVQTPHQVAEWWLKRVQPDQEGGWTRVRDGSSGKIRHLSIWRSVEYDAAVTIDTRTGKLIAIRFNVPVVSKARLITDPDISPLADGAMVAPTH